MGSEAQHAISRWFPIIKSLDTKSVCNCIPSEFRQYYDETTDKYDSKHINFALYERKLRSSENKKQTKFNVIIAGSNS